MTKEEALKNLEFERKWLSDAGYNAYNVDIAFDAIRTIIKVLCGDEHYEERSEWEQDHEILKAYSDGANEILDKIKEDIRHFMFEVNPSSSESDYACNYIMDIIDKYKAESEG